MWKGFVAPDLDLLPDVPSEVEVVTVESAQGTDRLIEGAGPELPFVLQDDEEVQDPIRVEGREISVREVIGELLDPAVVSSAGALR